MSSFDPPAFLYDRAAQHWPELARLLADMGVMADSDRLALALLAEWIEAGRVIEARRSGPT